ncbi:hypothetical protein [Saccharothrix sp. ST-888]|nr:hypothetical protein [Saccharothrix sp. ST-888]
MLLIAAVAFDRLPLGENPLLRHGPQLVGVLLIGQGAYLVAGSRRAPR